MTQGVKICKGLCKEGWSITKTLPTEITFLTIVLVTFVVVIQEFSIFAIVGLISDFFMQMLFHCTAEKGVTAKQTKVHY